MMAADIPPSPAPMTMTRLLSAAAFMIRDGGMKGEDICVFEEKLTLGGALDGALTNSGYSLRGGRMMTFDAYECTWDLFKSIPSLSSTGKTVFQETVEFNQTIKSHTRARLVDQWRSKVATASMGFSMKNRLELLRLSQADE